MNKEELVVIKERIKKLSVDPNLEPLAETNAIFDALVTGVENLQALLLQELGESRAKIDGLIIDMRSRNLTHRGTGR